MAVRNVDTAFWSDVKVMETFTPDDKYFWLFLLTTRYGNLAGCFEMSPKQAMYELGYKDVQKVIGLINRFIEVHEMIDYDFNTNEILILNWTKYNHNSSPHFQRAVEKSLAKIKSKRLLELFFNDKNMPF